MTGADPIGWPEYPGLGTWLPTRTVGRVLANLAELSDVDGWVRAVPDSSAPFPFVRLELAWLQDAHLHLVAVAGCTIAVAWPGPRRPRVVDHRLVSLDDLVEFGHGLAIAPP